MASSGTTTVACARCGGAFLVTGATPSPESAFCPRCHDEFLVKSPVQTGTETPGSSTAIRDDLEVISLEDGGYLLRDPASGASFEIGPVEKRLTELLDGHHTMEEVVSIVGEELDVALSTSHAMEFLEQLRLNGLLRDSAPLTSRPAEPPSAPPAPLSKDDQGARLNAFFDLLVVLFGGLIHPAVLAPVVGLAVVAGVGLVKTWPLAYDHWKELFVEVAFPIIFIIVIEKLLFLDLPRALFLGMTYRKFGGRLSSFGLRLYRGVLPYVSCGIEESIHAIAPRARYRLLTVRLWVQLAVASLAVTAWLMTVNRSPLSHFYLLLAIPGVVGLLLQLNIFQPLDGYHIFCVRFEIPDLYNRALAETRAWLTVRRAPEALTRRERFWFRCYGLAAYTWKFILTAGVIVLGSWVFVSRLGRVGALISVILLLRWSLGDVRSWNMNWEPMNWLIRTGGKWYVRWPIRLLVVVGLIVIANFPYDYEIAGECRVVPAAQYGARAQVAAEVVSIDVQEGDLVEAGDLIATLTDRDVGTAVATTVAKLEAARAEHERLVNGPLPEEIAVLEREVDRLEIEKQFWDAEVRRFERLVETEIKSVEELDRQMLLRDAAIQNLAGAKERLARARIGTRSEEIAAAKAEMDRLEAELAFHQREEGLLEIRTPIAGRVVTPFVQQRLGQVAGEGELICIVESLEYLAEVEADEAAVTEVEEGMRAEIRLWGLDGRPLRGTVVRRAHSAWNESDPNDYAVRSDRELLLRRVDEFGNNGSRFRVYVKLDGAPRGIVSGMSGYSKITIREEKLWHSVSRPVIRFFRTEVWSWLP